LKPWNRWVRRRPPCTRSRRARVRRCIRRIDFDQFVQIALCKFCNSCHLRCCTGMPCTQSTRGSVRRCIPSIGCHQSMKLVACTFCSLCHRRCCTGNRFPCTRPHRGSALDCRSRMPFDSIRFDLVSIYMFCISTHSRFRKRCNCLCQSRSCRRSRARDRSLRQLRRTEPVSFVYNHNSGQHPGWRRHN